MIMHGLTNSNEYNKVLYGEYTSIKSVVLEEHDLPYMK